MVDPDVLVRRLRELDRRLGLLAALHGSGDRTSYLADIAVQAQVERHLQIAIQSAIDVAVHVVTEDTSRTPEDYADAFAVLADEALLPGELADRLRLSAGMRNILVHGYADVDPAIVWSALGQLDDLRAFAATMRSRLGGT